MRLRYLVFKILFTNRRIDESIRDILFGRQTVFVAIGENKGFEIGFILHVNCDRVWECARAYKSVICSELIVD